MLGTKTTLRSFRYRVRPERSYGPPRPPKPPRSGYGGWRDDDDNDDDDMRANSQKKRFFTWKTWIKYVLVPTVVLFFCGGFLLLYFWNCLFGFLRIK